MRHDIVNSIHGWVGSFRKAAGIPGHERGRWAARRDCHKTHTFRIIGFAPRIHPRQLRRHTASQDYFGDYLTRLTRIGKAIRSLRQ